MGNLMTEIQVKKRDGRMVPFNFNKIVVAIEAAKNSIADGLEDCDVVAIANDVATQINEKMANTITVEEIQDMVEETLMKSGSYKIAKNYILYRGQRSKARNINESLLDYKNVVDGYLKMGDWRVKENSTVSYSLGGLILSNSGAITANYWLSEIYPEEIANAHRNTDMHIHDLSMLSGYCAGWSLKQLILEGLGGVTGKITSDPAKHLSTLCNQMVNFLGIMQNEWAGAQAFSSFDTYLAPFVKADNLTYKQVKQCIQSFAYGVNTPSRWGCVDTDTEVLSTNGWKKYNELQKEDFIYTWKDGLLNINPVNAVVIKNYKGKMHSYKNKRAGFGYEQTVTSDHRVLYKNETGDWNISHSDEIFDKDYALPVAFSGSLIGSSKCNQDDCYKIINNISNGNYDIEKYQLTQNDARTIFRGLTDSSSGYIRTKDNEELIDCVQHLAILAGYATNTMYDDWEGYDGIMYYITKYNTNEILPTEKESYDYDGIVWCPSVDDGTAVFRRNGSVFISGQCQAPFTNITLDVNCPPDMIDMPALVGGEPQDFTYGDCKEEMEMVNKAFIEVMIEGDADGRGLQYPIEGYDRGIIPCCGFTQ